MLLPIPSFNAKEAIQAAYTEENKTRLDKEALKTAAISRFAEIAISLLGPPNLKLSTPNNLRFGHKGSISVDLKKCLYHNYETGEGGDVLSLAMRARGYNFGNAVEFLKSFLSSDFNKPPFDVQTHALQIAPSSSKQRVEREREKRIAYARSIFEGGDNKSREVICSYFKDRNCNKPRWDCLRSKYVGCQHHNLWQLIAGITDPTTGCITGVHITTLEVSKDHKVSVAKHRGKIVHGVQKGSVIRLLGDKIAGHVAIAEGIETALSINGVFDCVLSAINAGNLAKLEMPYGVTQVSVFADNDRAGLNGAYKMQTRCMSQGIMCSIFIPPAGFNDFNDYRRSLI